MTAHQTAEGEYAAAVALAESIVTAQEAEIEEMQGLLGF